MLAQLRLQNFKSWEDTGDIAFKPITGFFGPNSSGKSSLFQAMLMMKQTAESPDRRTVLHFGDERTLVDLGDFESVVHKHDTKRKMKFSLGWQADTDVAIPDICGGGAVSPGDDSGFEAEIGETSTAAGKTLTLEEVSYRIADGRQFGLRRTHGEVEYVTFPFRSTVSSPATLRHLPFKFHQFPYWATEDFRVRDFFLRLEIELTSLLEDLHYLGPLRANPRRIYSWSGADPLDTGPAGEFVVAAILSYRQRHSAVIGKPNYPPAVDEYVAGWLKQLGLVHDFRVEQMAEGRRVYEVKVQKSIVSPEVLLADVGFGVSQILPVLTLCFYVSSGSTVILDHPDIHLHPSAQAGLADVFIDAWKNRGVQVLFESHSEHLLRRLQRRIAEEKIGQDDVGLFFCSTNDVGASNLRSLEVDRFGNISNWPEDFFGDQFGEIAAMSEAALTRQGASE